jgi:alpha-mannosidase
VDEQGAPIPYQNIDPLEALSAPRGRIRRLVFRATLPPLGYRTFRFAPGLPRADAEAETDAEADVGAAAAVDAAGATLTNDLLHLRLDGATGNIISCRERRSGLELVGPGGWNVGEVVEDHSDTWSHGVRGYGAAGSTFGDAQIRVGDCGPLQASLLLERRHGAAVWRQQIILRQGERALTIRNWLTWLEPWQLVKLACDVNTPAPVATHDVPFGALTRPCDGQEFPTHMWLDVTGPCAETGGEPVGLALLNDGKYGCDVTGSSLRLTILRCVPYAYHDPHPFGTRGHYDWVDMGSQEFTVVLCPHVGDWQASDCVARARGLNQPPLLVTMHSHGGDLPLSTSLAALDPARPGVELTACKVAESEQEGGAEAEAGYSVRLVELHGRGGPLTFTWCGQPISVTLAPYEIVTLRLRPSGGGWQAARCDLLERVKA